MCFRWPGHELRSLIKSMLLKHDIVLSRPPGQFSIGATKLLRIRDRGLLVRCAVDGGAASGGWTRELKAAYPEARVLCVEPRRDAQKELERLAAEFPGTHLAATLLGAEEKAVNFNISAEQSSVLPDFRGEHFGQVAATPMTTLDRLIERLGLPQPDLIKLDLQGYELQALAGAEKALTHAQGVLLEASFIAFQEGMPLLADVIAFMKDRAFRCYDVFGLWHRPLDGALVQGDFFFLSESSPLLRDRRWSAEAVSA